MRAHDGETQLAAMAPSRQGVGDPFTGVTDADTVLHVTVEAEDALRLVCEHFERTDDPEAQGELAVEALDHVERQLALTRHRRQGLDSIEGKLWARRNALERFLIHTRGRAWWRERRSLAQPGGPASEQT
jgi:hypothetical protein